MSLRLAAAVVFLVAATVLVGTLPLLLRRTFTTVDAALLAQFSLATLGVVAIWSFRRFPPAAQSAAHTAALVAAVWTPFVFFVVDVADAGTADVDVESSVVLGVAAFLLGAASMNLVRAELARAPSLLTMWVAAVGFAGHVCLAFAWRASGPRTAEFWVVFAVVVAVGWVSTIVVIRCSGSASLRRCVRGCCGLRWHAEFDKFRVFVVATECVGVLSLSQATEQSGRSVVAVVVALLFAVFWALVFLDATFRVVWRLTFPLTSRVGLNLNLNLPSTTPSSRSYALAQLLLGIGSVACFSVTSAMPSEMVPGWVVLTSAALALLTVPRLATHERRAHQTFAVDLLLLGICVALHNQAVMSSLALPNVWIVAAPCIVVLVLVLLVRPLVEVTATRPRAAPSTNRSAAVLVSQAALLVSALVNVFVVTSKDAMALGASAVLGLLSVPWIVYWFFRTVIATRKAAADANIRPPTFMFAAAMLVLIGSVVGLFGVAVYVAVAAANDENTLTVASANVVGFLVGIVLSALALMVLLVVSKQRAPYVARAAP